MHIISVTGLSYIGQAVRLVNKVVIAARPVATSQLARGCGVDPGLRRDDKEGAMASEARFLMVQFLDWVDCRPRRYAEIRDAWSSTCPLNCAWEDAVADDLIERGAAGSLVLTARGQARLAARM